MSNRRSYSKQNLWISRLSDLASRTEALIISNKQMEDIMKIVKPSEKSGLLLK